MIDSLKLFNSLSTLCVFKNILDDRTISNFLDVINPDTSNKAIAYSKFVGTLYDSTTNFSVYIYELLKNDINQYILMKSKKQKVPPFISECVLHELNLLNYIASLTSNDLKAYIGFSEYLPDFETENIDIKTEYIKYAENSPQKGYGVFSKYHMFRFDGEKLLPVKSPDNVDMSDLYEYKYEHDLLTENTRALLFNKPSANAFLYGDAGTGKSSSVKAVANLFKDNGLRLVEFGKKQLHNLPLLLDMLCANPLKFILFIDDLSFTRNDDDFAALKATLEGSASAKTQNIVIYVTSNRRHLIQENFADRNGDDIHLNDTLQELVSLSERFGLTITFTKPNKKTYNDIVLRLAEKYMITDSSDTILSEANIFALSKGGYSPRTAKQFVESLAARFYK